ncbi:Hsp70 protein-domain-containing protein [Aspergillus spectabilis]
MRSPPTRNRTPHHRLHTHHLHQHSPGNHHAPTPASTIQQHLVGHTRSTPLFLLLLFVLRAEACGGYDGPPEKLIGIHPGQWDARVGAIQDGRVTILTDRGGHEEINTLADIDPSSEAAMKRLGTPNLFVSRYYPAKPPPEMKVTDTIALSFRGTEYAFRPEEIYVPVLAKLRDLAESHIGPNITGAVVTIPSFFTDIDREHVKKAGDSIGLQIVRQMHEFTSQILSLGLDDLPYGRERYVLFADLETHGPLDISIPETDMGMIAPVLDELLDTAMLMKVDITDLVIFSSVPSYTNIQRGIKEYFPGVRIANTPKLDRAGVWAATLVSGWLSGEEQGDWVPCCCATRRPPIGICSDAGAWAEILGQCQSLPVYQKTSLDVSCNDDDEITTVWIYMQDVPCIDYHAMYELGDLYVPETGGGDVLLAVLNISAACDRTGVTSVEVEVFMSREGDLKFRGVDRKAEESL